MVNDKGTLACGLFIGIADDFQLPFTGTEIPYLSSSIGIHLVDLVAEVTLTYKFINQGDLPIRPTFIFPLNNVGVLCDVEVSVAGDKRIALDVDVEAVKSIMEQKQTRLGIEFHVIKPGEVAPNAEVTIKCLYVAITNVVDEAVQFTLPAYLIPPKPMEPGTVMRAYVSVDMHDKVTTISSPSHPEQLTSIPLAGGKASAEVTLGQELTKDLSLLVNCNNIRTPRVWTSVGTTGAVQSRMNMFVLCPPYCEPEGAARTGEVVLFWDVRDVTVNVEQVFAASLAKLPDWSHFNVWASFDGTSFTPIFENAVPANQDQIQSAIVKLKSHVPFSGEDASIPATVQTLLQSTITQYPRAFFFVSSMVTHFDDTLKIIAGSFGSTRTIVVSLQSMWNSAYPCLFTSNGGSLLFSSPAEIEALLPRLLEKNVQPAQFITFSPTPRPTHQYPLATPPLYHSATYLSFMLYYDQLGNVGEVELKAGEETAQFKAKEVSSQVLHRLGSLFLLSEIKVGLRQEITPVQKESLQAILYSPWTFQPITPKSNSSKTTSLTSFVASIKGGGFPRTPGGGKTAPALAKSGKDGGGLLGKDRRNMILDKHRSIVDQTSVNPADNVDRAKIPISELEAHALEIAVVFVRETLSPSRQLTPADSTLIRSAVKSVIDDPSSLCPDGTEGGVLVTKLKSSIQTVIQEKWKPEDETLWFEIDVTAEKGFRPYMEDQISIIESVNALYGLTSQPRIAFFGVFDGHQGRRAADYTKTNLPFNVLRNASFDATKLARSGEDEALKETIKEGYLKTDNDFLELAGKEGLKSGTTAVTVILLDSVLVVSNCGDSEAVICRDGKAIQLSTLHTPLNEEEQKRIVTAGGSIVQYGTWRVNGMLAVTRSIGDRVLKTQVTSVPDTVVEKVLPTDEFLILATDGLWGALKYQEAIDFVRSERAKILSGDEMTDDNTARKVSRRLVDEALRRESKDNVTAMVIFFKHPSP